MEDKNDELPKYDRKMNTLCLIVLGMAGSGKTTFVKKLEEHLNENEKESYIINMDPAVINTFYEANMDIRDTINYKEMMKSHNLGPNGSIMTCLNIFATQIHKIVDVLSKKDNLDYVIVDTPGQLEVFSWSASGKLICDSISLIFPSVLLYIVDVPRCQNPNTFVSNMMYGLSIMYKIKLPLIIIFNKKDVIKEDFCVLWTKDYEELELALNNHSDYISSYSRSLCLVLEEFYKTIKICGVSSQSGEGFDNLITILGSILKDYMKEKEDAS